MRIILSLIVLTLLFNTCGTAQSNSKTDDFKYSFDKPVEGQIHTAERLREFMDNKEYDDAIILFSKAERENIDKIKQDQNMFDFWCMAWTFDSGKFNRYINKIKENKARFIFEDEMWKINEK